MRTNRDRYEQIARRAAVDACVALTALLDGLSLVDASRNVNLELACLTHASRAAALGAWLLDDLAGTAAVRAGALRLEHAERRALRLRHCTGTAAVRTGLGACALGRARAAALVTGLDAVNGNLFFAAEGCFLKRQDNVLSDGFTALRRIAARGASAAEAAAKE